MTRTSRAAPPDQPRPKRPRPSGTWLLQDAKARFSELVRRARSEGPQHVTVHGREEVVVVAAEEFRRLTGAPTGKALVAALQASPDRGTDIEPSRGPLPVRDVGL
ncbi:MAG TPA: type II toxin-antitoxin system prevent-host-death family antitoxin [Acidisphaera sp.]|nr:type II toxin-antitoxin system prevent-host-death family antitoxin [Acidisphaera sp.]